MFEMLPPTAVEFLSWAWPQIEPYFTDLKSRPLTDQSVERWLADWSRLAELVEESYWRLYVATTINTTDRDAQHLFATFLEVTQPAARSVEQTLKIRLLDSGLEPPGFEMALRHMRADVALYHQDNLPLLAEEKTLGSEYQKIRGAQAVMWNGTMITLAQLNAHVADPRRDVREQAWRLGTERRLQDRAAINANWQRYLRVRNQLALNAGHRDYASYKWQQYYRFAYTPADCEDFHAAIARVVVPAATLVSERRRKRLGVDRLRPWDAGWDLHVDSAEKPPLHPYQTTEELVRKTGAIFRRLDPALGDHFDVMARENLLDLDSRPGKAAGAYSTTYAAARRPFIFMNGVGLHVDLLTLIHESGHAFHWSESYRQPYFQNRGLDYQPIEFVEVASTAMEYLTAPALADPEIGFYTPEDAIRAEIEHLEAAILFWPNMAVVDAFQLWVYRNFEEALDPARCDAKWAELTRRYVPDIDWSGLDDELASGWQHKAIMFESPLYYVEYGLAQLGAIQIWKRWQSDPSGALAQYRTALGLGSTLSLPELYRAAGARLAWDAQSLRGAVDLLLAQLDNLESS
jgi:oligoendopeptidase F